MSDAAAESLLLTDTLRLSANPSFGAELQGIISSGARRGALMQSSYQYLARHCPALVNPGELPVSLWLLCTHFKVHEEYQRFFCIWELQSNFPGQESHILYFVHLNSSFHSIQSSASLLSGVWYKLTDGENVSVYLGPWAAFSLIRRGDAGSAPKIAQAHE